MVNTDKKIANMKEIKLYTSDINIIKEFINKHNEFFKIYFSGHTFAVIAENEGIEICKRCHETHYYNVSFVFSINNEIANHFKENEVEKVKLVFTEYDDGDTVLDLKINANEKVFNIEDLLMGGEDVFYQYYKDNVEGDDYYQFGRVDFLKIHLIDNNTDFHIKDAFVYFDLIKKRKMYVEVSEDLLTPRFNIVTGDDSYRDYFSNYRRGRALNVVFPIKDIVLKLDSLKIDLSDCRKMLIRKKQHLYIIRLKHYNGDLTLVLINENEFKNSINNRYIKQFQSRLNNEIYDLIDTPKNSDICYYTKSTSEHNTFVVNNDDWIDDLYIVESRYKSYLLFDNINRKDLRNDSYDVVLSDNTDRRLDVVYHKHDFRINMENVKTAVEFLHKSIRMIFDDYDYYLRMIAIPTSRYNNNVYIKYKTTNENVVILDI